MPDQARIGKISCAVYKIPTDAPEADGTFEWDSTTLVVAEVEAAGVTGLGYTYGSPAVLEVIRHSLSPVLDGEDAFAIEKLWAAMVREVRNIGWRGIAACAISVLDVALWDLKARLFGLPLVRLFSAAREEVPIYGSGGFTSYSHGQTAEQFGFWVGEFGCRWVKMKIGSDPGQDPERVRRAREAIGDAGLFVDANGAFAQREALHACDWLKDFDVRWFEEPVSSDDLEGLRLVRDRAPSRMAITAGEYGYEPFYFRRMLEAGAVDVLQADATRCCGYTGFLRAAALADAHSVPLSAHTAPALHLPVCCAAPRLRHVEWFHDHARIEAMLFDGAPEPMHGVIRPDPSRPGHGLDFKRADAAQFAI